MFDDEEDCISVSEGEDEILGGDTHVVAEGPDYTAMGGDFVCHVADDGVNGEGE